MPVVEVAVAAEGAYVPHSAALVHSALEACPRGHVRIHYLHGRSLRRRARSMLRWTAGRGGGEIVFHEIAPERLAGLPVSGRYTAAMWYRILLPELLPGVERVLYLDVDTIVLDDLSPLWRLDLGGRLVAAVTNVFEDWSRHRPEQLGIAARDYFNSGVLLLNLDEMRVARATEALREVAARQAGVPGWPDQDALNIVLGGRRLELHPRWNAMNSVLALPGAESVYGDRALAEARARPAIRHFEGPEHNKPWHPESRVPGRELYLSHRRATPWRLKRLS